MSEGPAARLTFERNASYAEEELSEDGSAETTQR